MSSQRGARRNEQTDTDPGTLAGDYKPAVFNNVKLKADCSRLKEITKSCFGTVVLEKTLESPWAARGSSQSILKEICPEYSSKGLMLKLKLQYFVHLMRRTDSLEKTLMVGKLEGGRRG